MSNIAITPNSSGTGTISITAPNTNTNRTIALPDTAGNVITTGDTGTVVTGMVANDAITSAKIDTNIVLEGTLGVGTGSGDTTLHVKGDNPRVRVEGTDNTVKYDIFMGNTAPLVGTTSNHAVKYMVNDSEVGQLKPSGALQFAKAASYSSWSGNIEGHQFVVNDAATVALTAHHEHASVTAGVFRCLSNRGPSSAYNMLVTTTGSLTDDQHRLRADGNAYADASWNANGADYAEYFEWADGNSSAEDRRGLSVVLVNNKIRKATSDDTTSSIIGVISGNPSVVGDAAWSKWNGKYLMDDFGAYDLDADGDRQLNPDHDADATYIPRENRDEWDAVGLMGKLRLKVGQPTGDRWIKMRDVSGSIEEWLVR